MGARPGTPRRIVCLTEETTEVLYRMGEEDRLAMGERGRAYVRKHHDYPKLAQELAQVLERLDGHVA